MAVEESDEDKKLITGEVLSNGTEEFPDGSTVIFGKYALLTLAMQGVDYHILDINDVVGSTEYKES